MRLKYNGTFLDTIVDGIQILGTDGRHSLELDVVTKENIYDGSEFINARIPERTISVYIFIPADTEDELKEKYDKLYNALNQKEEVAFRFTDEADRYYKGIFLSGSLVRSVRNNNTAMFQIQCVDPYKYAVEEKSATDTTATTADGDTVRVLKFENNGNVPCPVVYTVTNNSDNGFISLTSDQGEWMVFGDMTEQDGEKATKSVIAFRDKTAEAISSDTSFTAADQSGIEFIYNTDSSTTVKTILDKSVYTVNSYGTKPTSTGKYYGVARSHTITSSVNVTIGAHVTFCTDNTARKGLLCMTLNSGGVAVADMYLLKPYTTDLTGKVYCRARDKNGDVVATESVGFQAGITNVNNPFNETSDNAGYIEIRKAAGTLYFNVAGTEVQLSSSTIKTKGIDSVTIWICKYTDADKGLNYIGFKDIFVRRDMVEYQKDIPNRYAQGDVLSINGNKGTMRKNGTLCNGDEILGSKYFKIPSGTHNVLVGQSEWASKVTITATFRERWV